MGVDLASKMIKYKSMKGLEKGKKEKYYNKKSKQQQIFCVVCIFSVSLFALTIFNEYFVFRC